MIAMVTGAQFAFWMLAPIMVLAACVVVLARKPVHAALSLAVVMISLAVQYAALEAPFLFAVQIIVYTGAILMLFLFVVMLIGVDARESAVETLKGHRGLAAVAGVAFAVLLIIAVGNLTTTPRDLTAANTEFGGNIQGLAALIFHRYVFAFELTSGLLITAALGAMVLAHRERVRAKKTQRDMLAERMHRYAKDGTHPGPLPTPGVYARNNAVDVPALLPDGTPAEHSVSDTLRTRGQIIDATDLDAPTRATLRAITSDDPEDDEGPGTGSDIAPTDDRKGDGQ